MSRYIIQLVCHNCVELFERRHDRVHKTQNFCCRACRKQWHKENVIDKRSRKCLLCATKFTPRSTQIRNGQGKFCSIECSIKNVHSLPITDETRAKLSAWQKGKEGLRGDENSNWKGGKYDGSDGYKYVLIAPMTYMAEHRLLMQNHLGRKLTPDDIVHHKNRDKADNRLENLQVMTRSEHMIEHHEEITRPELMKVEGTDPRPPTVRDF